MQRENTQISGEPPGILNRRIIAESLIANALADDLARPTGDVKYTSKAKLYWSVTAYDSRLKLIVRAAPCKKKYSA